MMQDRYIRPDADGQLALAAENCRRALADDGSAALAAALGADAPATPEGWFDLLARYPDRHSYDTMIRLKDAAAAAGHGDGARLEQYAVLQAMSVAAPRMMALPLPASVKLQFAQLCERVAAPVPAVRRQLDIARAPFAEMAMLATLRRYPAGEVVFDYAHMPKSWLLKIHPLNLPGFAAGLISGTGGTGPFAAPHVNAWRQNPLIMQKEEHQRALWRIAKTLELNPHLQGLMTDAWLISLAAGEAFPHLAWLRALYQETGAYLVDLEPAPDDSGFMVGSTRRRQLYSEGQFNAARWRWWPRDRPTIPNWRTKAKCSRKHPSAGASGRHPKPGRRP
jgi:hypothetical protein